MLTAPFTRNKSEGETVWNKVVGLVVKWGYHCAYTNEDSDWQSKPKFRMVQNGVFLLNENHLKSLYRF